MMKTILVAVAGTSKTRAALDTAIALGRSFDAHLECLRIHPDPAQILAQASNTDMGSGMVVADMWQAFQDDDVRRTKSSRDAFDQACRREKVALAERPTATVGMTAAWREETGEETQQLIGRARFNDLAVIEHPSGGGGFPPLSAGAVLVGAGRPILVAPPESPRSLTRKIAIAWKDSPEAAKAVASALPLLAKADEIVVLGVSEEAGDQARLRRSLDNAVKYLAWHGRDATGRVVSPHDKNPADSMLAAVFEEKADLLVMGGYGHSRLREMIFGGFTRRVLNGVALPVFLSH